MDIAKKTAQRFMRNARGKGAYKLSGRYWRISQGDFQRLIEELKSKPPSMQAMIREALQ